MMKQFFTVAILLTLFASCKKDGVGDATPVSLQDKVLTSNLNFPWEILWGPDNMIWMTERLGKISRVNPSTGVTTLLFTVPDVTSYTDFNGLLGMVLHPDFTNTPQVFVVYNYGPRTNYKEKVVRYTYNGTTLINPQIILDNIRGIDSGSAVHNGSRLLITPDNKLYITTGDAQDTTLPQNMTSLNGKILRVNLDGSIPSDNPNPSSPIWTSGHRNVQGIALVNGKIYVTEHGPNTDDEINLIEKGRNYGWPFVRGFCDLAAEQTFCGANNVREPLIAWTPTIAPSGMEYYEKDLVPQWKNTLLFTTLKDKRLMQYTIGSNTTKEFLVDKYGRLRDLAISPEGKLYICTDNGNNQDVIVEIGPSGN